MVALSLIYNFLHRMALLSIVNFMRVSRYVLLLSIPSVQQPKNPPESDREKPAAAAAANWTTGHSPHISSLSAVRFVPWLPDGLSRIFRSYVIAPLSFSTMAPLHYTAKFVLIKFCHLATLRTNRTALKDEICGECPVVQFAAAPPFLAVTFGRIFGLLD